MFCFLDVLYYVVKHNVCQVYASEKKCIVLDGKSTKNRLPAVLRQYLLNSSPDPARLREGKRRGRIKEEKRGKRTGDRRRGNF